MEKLRKIELSFTNGQVNPVAHAVIERILSDDDGTSICVGKAREAFDISGATAIFGRSIPADILAIAQDIANSVKSHVPVARSKESGGT